MDKNILPPDFDGVFRFTNFTDSEFKARWNNIEYTFPSAKTTPLIIPGATPEEVQHIRKKFAKELALVEFSKTDKFHRLNEHTPGGHPAPYTESDLTPFIQRCLEPLPLAQAAMKQLPKDDAKNYKTDEEGKPITRVLGKNEKLLGNDSAQITE